MRRWRDIAMVGLFAVVALAALALGHGAFRHAAARDAERLRGFRDALAAETEALAAACAARIVAEKRHVLDVMRTAQGRREPAAWQAEMLRLPLVRAAFVADAEGTVLLPHDDLRFRERFAKLLFEPTLKEGTVLFPDGENSSGDGAAAAAGRRMLTRFALETAGRDEGWISWFSDDRLCLALWCRTAVGPGGILGVEFEEIALLARLAGAMPRECPPFTGFLLLDEHGRTVAGVGHVPAADDGLHRISREISSALLPQWRIQGVLDERSLAGGASAQVAGVLQAVSLSILVLLGLGAALLATRREMALARQKTSFVANVSHELKTPLTNIRMYAELLQRGGANAEGKRDKYLGVILSESERLSRLIANVLDFSRIEAGEKRFRIEETDVRAVVAEVLEANRAALAEQGFAVEADLPDAPLRLPADRDALAQALQNLVSNALKYAADGRFLRIALEADGGDGRAGIVVADRGLGVPPHARRKIFGKFYRCDDALTAKTGGSGLGLAIARSLMRGQGGDVVFRPALGGGAAFRIILGERKTRHD